MILFFFGLLSRRAPIPEAFSPSTSSFSSHGTQRQCKNDWVSKQIKNAPLSQPHQQILHRASFSRERGHLPPTRLSVFFRPRARAEGVAHHVLAGGGGQELGFGGQAADNGDFCEARGGGGGEGSKRNRVEGTEEGGEDWAERGHVGYWVLFAGGWCWRGGGWSEWMRRGFGRRTSGWLGVGEEMRRL